MRVASAAARIEFERLKPADLGLAMDGEGPRAVFWSLLDLQDKALLRRALHTRDEAWDGVRRERRVVQDLLAPKPVPPSDPTISTAQEYWRRVYSDAVNSGQMPTTASQADAVYHLLDQVCALCGAQKNDRIGGSVETVQGAVRSIRLAGQRFWTANNPPPAGGTVQDAAAWWHAAAMRYWQFDLVAVLVGAGEADSLGDAGRRLRRAVEAVLAGKEKDLDSVDPEFLRAAGLEWRVFVLTVKVKARLRLLAAAGHGGHRLAVEVSDPKAMLAALDEMEAAASGKTTPPRVSRSQGEAQPRGQQGGKQSRQAGQEEKMVVRRGPTSPRSQRPSRWSLARFWNAVRRWLRHSPS